MLHIIPAPDRKSATRGHAQLRRTSPSTRTHKAANTMREQRRGLLADWESLRDSDSDSDAGGDDDGDGDGDGDGGGGGGDGGGDGDGDRCATLTATATATAMLAATTTTVARR
ncbi:hypothetical protein [Winogradskya humida]|nr:hypothetical protein [Actinoplanes humidus]